MFNFQTLGNLQSWPCIPGSGFQPGGQAHSPALSHPVCWGLGRRFVPVSGDCVSWFQVPAPRSEWESLSSVPLSRFEFVLTYTFFSRPAPVWNPALFSASCWRNGVAVGLTQSAFHSLRRFTADTVMQPRTPNYFCCRLSVLETLVGIRACPVCRQGLHCGLRPYVPARVSICSAHSQPSAGGAG